MIARRPFGSREALLLAAARVEWDGLSGATGARLSATTRRSAIARRSVNGFLPPTNSRRASRPASTRHRRRFSTRLRRGIDATKTRFGYIFIVCASGLSAEEMLAMLTDRLGNDPTREIQIAAAEQAKITALRLG